MGEKYLMGTRRVVGRARVYIFNLSSNGRLVKGWKVEDAIVGNEV